MVCLGKCVYWQKKLVIIYHEVEKLAVFYNENVIV